MSEVMVFDHPLIQHKIGIIRDETTNKKIFRETVSEIAMLMAYEVTRNLPLKEATVKTPICETTIKKIEDNKIAIVPILRAGLGMVEGMLELLPNSKVGHVGLYRNHESFKPVPYYCKLPKNISESLSIVLDPMLATGGSACQAITYLKEQGAKDIKFMCLIASKEGIQVICEQHPDVDIYAAAVDEKLNDLAYIVPGLGDAGDRLFGTL